MVFIGNIALDNGIPKLCIPLTGRTVQELQQECRYIQEKPFDIIELRIDYLQDVESFAAIDEALKAIRQELPEAALLFTYRSFAEGGESKLSEKFYFQLAQHAIQSSQIDAIDLEYFQDQCQLINMITLAKQASVTVILSNHDFTKTPSYDEIVSRLIGMKQLGADVAKLACMPHSAKDVLTLLRATEEVKSRYPQEPLITMSMGSLGMISRISGELFGSALTFGSAKKASAPGQLEAEQLHKILHLLHR